MAEKLIQVVVPAEPEPEVYLFYVEEANLPPRAPWSDWAGAPKGFRRTVTGAMIIPDGSRPLYCLKDAWLSSLGVLKVRELAPIPMNTPSK